MKLDKELMLLKVALAYPDIWDNEIETFDYLSVIENPFIRNIFTFIRGFLEKTGKHPTIQDILLQFDDDPSYYSYLREAVEYDITPQHAVSILEEELKKKALLKLTAEILPKIKEEGVDVEKLWEAGREALQIRRKEADVGIDYLSADPSLYLTQESQDNYIRTLTELDVHMPMHGFRKGWVCLTVGGPGFGKSLLMQNFALAALLERKSVLYVTLEMLENEVMGRLDMMLLSSVKTEAFKNNIKEGNKQATFVTMDDIRREMDLLIDIRESFKKYLLDEAFLKIVYIPPQELSPIGLEKLIDRVETSQKKKIDLVIIDYADLMRSDRPMESKWEETANIFQSLKRVAVRKDVLIWTGTQLGKKGMYKQIATQADIYGSSEKSFNTDYIITIQKTKEETVNVANSMRVTFTKARFGASSFSPLTLNLEGLLVISPSTITSRLLPFFSGRVYAYLTGKPPEKVGTLQNVTNTTPATLSQQGGNDERLK